MTVLKDYRIILRDARGRFTKKLSKAAYFAIIYKKKIVYKKEAFSKRTKLVKQKAKKIASTLSKIERLRQRILKNKKKKLLEIKKKRIRTKAIRKADVKAQKSLPKDEADLNKSLKKSIQKISKEKLQKPKIEKSQTRPSRVEGDVVVIPIQTKSKDYKKSLIFKVIMSEPWQRKFKIKILDFSLVKSIKISASNAEASADHLWKIFMPHLLLEWGKQKWSKKPNDIKNRMIFRLKYKIKVGKKYLSGGISGPSFVDGRLPRFKEYILRELLYVLKKFIEDNYFGRSSDAKIRVTGFTFELVEKDLGYWNPYND